MIRRPLNTRFAEAVLRGEKTSTIRDKPWPVGEPIMLFTWTGVPYRSKQADVAPVVVSEVREIRITRRGRDGRMLYAPNRRRLHETEGFATPADMNAWFRPLVRPGKTVTKWLMLFRLAHNRSSREGGEKG